MRYLILSVLCVLAFSTLAQAYTEITSCSVLNSAGEYYKLTSDINDHGSSCMNITADNIVLDCAGNTIDGTNLGIWEAGVNVTGVTGVKIANCTVQQFHHGMYLENSASVVLNSTYPTESVPGSELTRQWVVKVGVSDGSPVSGASITLYNRTSDSYDTGLTDSNGIAIFEVTEYKNSSGATRRWTNYTAEASKSGYASNSVSFNFTTNTLVNITLTASPSSSSGGGGRKHDVEIRLPRKTYHANKGERLELDVLVRNRGDYNERDVLVYLSGLPEGWTSTNETISLEEREEKTVTLTIHISPEASGSNRLLLRLSNDENRDKETVIFDVKPCSRDSDCPGMFCEQGVCVEEECDCGFFENGECVAYECCSNSDCGSGERCADHVCVPIPVQQEPEPEVQEPEPEVEPPAPQEEPEEMQEPQAKEPEVTEGEREEPVIEQEAPQPEAIYAPAYEPVRDYESLIMLLVAIAAILTIVLLTRPKGGNITRKIKKRIPRPRKRYAIEGPPRGESAP
ncbi:MAG: hypothetical protein JXB14_02620 [Candidatus Altiarchaeota archaeon]|nr:hypothetical protein [Candidatus Altiarchaeota archaeon]